MVTSLGGIEWALLIFAIFGIALGIFSLGAPAHSIQLYQGIMRFCNWRVEPLDYTRELRNTRVLGAMLAVLSALIVTAWIRPEWVLTCRLPSAALSS